MLLLFLLSLLDAGLNFGGDKDFNFQSDKMLMVEDFNLHLMQGYTSSLKEALKQTMLSQEVMFRKQVHELHRLYSIQKTLMEDFCWKELDECNLWKVSTQSTSVPFTIPIQYSPLAKEKFFSRRAMLSFLEENRGGYCSLQQRPFDLQLPADQYLNHVGEDPLEEGNGWDLNEPVEKHRFHDDNVSSLEELKLTLNIGGDTRKKGVGKRTWDDKITHSTSHYSINLEESTDTVSKEDAKTRSTISCAALITGDNHDSRIYVQSNRVSTSSVRKDLSHGLTVNYSFVDGTESYEEQNSFYQGFKEQNGDNDIFTKAKPFTSNEAIGLDLNRVQFDDSSYMNGPMVALFSKVGSSFAFDGLMGKFYEGTCPCPPTTSWRKPNVNCSNGPSTLLQQDAAANPILINPDSNNSSLRICASNATFKGISRSEACPIDLESVSGPLPNICEDLGSDHRNSSNGNIDYLLKFQKGNCTEVTAEVTEKEDIVFSHSRRDGNSNKSPTPCKFDCIADDSSRGAKTMQSGTDLGRSNISAFNQFPKSRTSQVAETESGEQDLRSSDSSELKHQCCIEKEESAGEDVLVQKAAESLIHFSLGSSTIDQDCCTKAGPNEIANEGSDRPQYSLDSYESIVLKLTESSVDDYDYCVSSKPFEVNEPDKKDCGMKLRRGRRLKDFQRDVLPGLASLSKHEIWEDVNIMEAVIRSREYKRMRSKMADGGNRFAPIKSRRSRLNYVGRRYYS